MLSEHQTSGERELSRRDILVKGALVTAGAAGAVVAGRGTGTAFAATQVTKTRIAVVSHGDNAGSFWSVFKRGVDRAVSDLRAQGVSATQVYAQDDVSRQVAGLNAAIAAKVDVIVTTVPNASALEDPLTKASRRGIEIITCNSGLGDFDSLPTYMVHVGQTETIAGEGAGNELNKAGVKNLVVIIGEVSNSAYNQRYEGVKKTFKGTVKHLVIPYATRDLPGTSQKIAAYFAANKSTDGLLTLTPDTATASMNKLPKGTKIATFDLSPGVMEAIKAGKILFAIDQQQYLQGYLPIVFGYLFRNNLNTVGNGRPVLTGPGIVNRANAARVEALAKKGTR